MTIERSAATPRIYVASLADYNAGRLHGRWIDADQGLTAIQEAIAGLLSESSEPIAEGWAIHDYQNFGDLRLSEFEDLEYVAEVASLMQEHGPVFGALVDYFGGSRGLEEARLCMEEGYQGAFDRVEDYAEQLVEECYANALKALPDFIRHQIDFGGIAHDLELSGDIFTITCDGQVHVFGAR